MPVGKYNAKQTPRMESMGGRGAFQRIWESIRARREDFTAFLVHSDSEATMGAIHHYVNALVKGGYVERVDQPDANRHQHFRLVNDCGIEYPRLNAKGEPIKRDLSTEAMWRTMRILGGDFTTRDLAAMASTEERPIAHTTASVYVGQLLKAGYVELVKKGGRQTAPRYRFVTRRYSGPRPPVVGRNIYVYDPNLDKVVWQEEINHDDL